VAALELDRSLEPSNQFALDLRRSQIKSTALIAAMVLVLAMALSYVFLARPARQLLANIQRIGDGDYRQTTETFRNDEFGDLARAVHDLAQRLEAAETSAGEQKRARAAILAQLRHADRLSTVGKLASGLAHELGTPLNVVSGRAELIRSDRNTSASNLKHAQIITERAEHMANLIRQLLSFSRRELRKGRTEVYALIEQAAHLVEPLAQAQGISLYVEAKPDDDLIASIDARSALQVLTNLMVNGIQAMSSQGTLRIAASVQDFAQAPDPRSAPGRYVGFVVEDEGAGIPKEQLDKIFDPFFTTKADVEGTGLGLSVCHGIVQEHGGWMDVESTLEEGTCFTAYFPAGVPS
jgi:signal transduction histidine kinase